MSARKSHLAVVREGNPGKRPVKEGVKAPLVDELDEPDWTDWFPELGRLPSKPRKPRSQDPDAEVDHALKLKEWARQCETIRDSRRSRDLAAREWQRVVPIIAKIAGLSEIDRPIVIDYCVTVSRLQSCERRISLEGIVVAGQKGNNVRNPLTPVAAQYRAQLRRYIGELGLSPSARSGITPPGDDDDEGVFD